MLRFLISFVVVSEAEDTTSLLQRTNVHKHDELFWKADALFDGALDKIDVHDPVKQALVMRMTQKQGWIGLVQRAKTLPKGAKRELLKAVANLPEVKNLMSREDLGLLQHVAASQETEASLQLKGDDVEVVDGVNGDAENAARGKDGGEEDAEHAASGKGVITSSTTTTMVDITTTNTTTTTTTITTTLGLEALRVIDALPECGRNWWWGYCTGQGPPNVEGGKVGCHNPTTGHTFCHNMVDCSVEDGYTEVCKMYWPATTTEIPTWRQPEALAAIDALPECNRNWWWGYCTGEGPPNVERGKVGCHNPTTGHTFCQNMADCSVEDGYTEMCKMYWPAYPVCDEDLKSNCDTDKAALCRDTDTNLTVCKSHVDDECTTGLVKCKFDW